MYVATVTTVTTVANMLRPMGASVTLGHMAPRLKYYSFEVVIEKEDGGKGYYSYCRNLPGCFSNGRTIEEARRNIREAIELHLESLSARSLPPAAHERLVHSAAS